ncbi:MAG: F0F1 ATP synthase subunit A [Acidobacteriia bacterium]|nr:F0F1 ATP synthase subunit A [Terriglobia bacterium]
MEHELWFTALLNKLLGSGVTAMLVKIGLPPADPARPIPNYVAMEILVILVILGGALLLRRRLSVEDAGRFQQAAEVVVEFTQGLVDDIIGPGGRRYVAMLATLGIFILLSNLLGLIPTLQTPTAHYQVTAGCAVAAFLYYNFHGFRHHGVLGYLKHLCGPMMGIAIVMFPVEVISNLFRMLSLTVRLWANMLVGDILEGIFTGLVPIAIPALFMALHVFVSFMQAYIFMLLPAVYLSFAVSEEH